MQDRTASELLDCLCSDALAHATAFRSVDSDGALTELELHAVGSDGQRFTIRGDDELAGVTDLARLVRFDTTDS